MFFGKNKTSLKLAKQHSELLEGCEYHIVEYLTNPKVVRVGSGISQLYLRNSEGDEYLIEGNASNIKELFVPVKTFEGLQGTSFKVKRPIGSLLQNQVLKEIASCPYDEKMQLGHGISEYYFIQKDTNKVIKFYGNSHQIKNLFEEIVVPVKLPEVKPVTPKTKIEIIERTIIKESTPVMGVQGFKGDEGIQGKQGIQGLRGDRGIQGEVGPQGEIGPQGEVGPQGPKGDNGDIGARGAQGLQGKQGIQGDKGDKGDQGVQGLVGPQGIPGTQGKQGRVGPEGPIGPQGSVGVQGPRGEKGEKGDRGPLGIQGSDGAKGERGDDGLVGPQGPAGESPVIEAEFPLVLDNGVLSFHSEHVTNVLNTFKNDDIQKAIDRIGILATPGGGGVDVSLNGDKIIRNPSVINFIGDNITITRRRKNIDISIAGATGNTGPTGPQGNTGIAGSGVAGNNDVGVAYLKNNAVATVISVVNERAVVAGGLTTGTCFNFQKHSTTNSLQYLGAGGRFHVVASFNFWTQSANDVCGFYIGCNRNISSGLSADADRISESEVYVESRNSTRPVAGTIQTVLDLNTDDRLFFIVQNRDDTHDITVQFLKFVAVTLTSERGATGVTGATGATPTDYVVSVNGQTGAVEYIVDFKRGWFLS